MQSLIAKIDLFHAQLEHFCFPQSSERYTVIKDYCRKLLL